MSCIEMLCHVFVSDVKQTATMAGPHENTKQAWMRERLSVYWPLYIDLGLRIRASKTPVGGGEVKYRKSASWVPWMWSKSLWVGGWVVGWNYDGVYFMLKHM